MSKRIYSSDESAGLLKSQPAGRIATAEPIPAGRLPTGSNMKIRTVTYGITSVYASLGQVSIMPSAPADEESPSDDTPAKA
jgi:hypothetical protein